MKIALLIAALVFVGTPALAQPIPSADASPTAARDGILAYAVQDSVAEVQLCRLALQRSQNPAVRDFAQRMIADHTQDAGTALALAHQLNVPDATKLEPGEDGKVRLAYLARYDGHTFDEHFMEANVDDHESDIIIFRNALETLGSTSPLAPMLRATIAQLEEHLRLAQATRDAVAQASPARS